jgi:hypothetical protein
MYGFDGEKGTKKWLGSTLGRPFIDYCFLEAKDGVKDVTLLVTIDQLLNGKLCFAWRTWTGFGYRLRGETGSWTSSKIVSVAPGQAIVEADGRRLTLSPVLNSKLTSSKNP